MRTLVVAGLAALAAIAVSGAGSAPAASPPENGRIVFASARPIPGQPSGLEIYSLDLATGRIRDLSRSNEDETAFALSPDGSRIAFARSSSGESGLWVMRRDGSAQRRLAELQVLAYRRSQEIAWSPDGTTIAFSAAQPDANASLWIVGADGSGLRQLTDFYAHAPSWSPSGAEIAFTAGDDPTSARVGVIGPAGTGLRWLTGTGDFSDTLPAWSPDGRWVAFVRTVGAVCEPACGSSNLFVVAADGSAERQVTAYLPGVYPPIPLESPAWSPNSRLLAFFRDGSGGHLDLIRADGTGLRTLARHSFAPATWSRAGNRLAFGQLRGNLAQEPGRWRLTVQALAGRARRYPLESPASPVLAGPYWARGGKALVFGSVSTDTDFELFSAGPQGGGLRRLTHDRVDEFEPTWSSDGRRIAYARGKVDRDQSRIARSSLYVMDVNGSRVRRLTRGSLDTGPSWAPSGRRIVFVRDHGLSILDLAGSRIRSLGVATDSEPGWSPDGRLIAFGSGTKLETVRPDGRGRQTLFDGGDNGVPAEIGRPSWSPDSRAIAVDLLYDHGRWTEESQVIVSTTGQVQATLLCSPPSPPPFEPEYYRLGNMLAWSPDGRWLAVDGIAVCRVDGSGGYWLRPGDDPDWLARRH